MTERSDSTPSPEGRSGSRLNAWSIGTPLVVLLSGVLFAVSGANSEGTDLRPGRYTGMATLAATERSEVHELQSQVNDLRDRIDALTARNANGQVKEMQQQVDRLEDPAGLSKESGEGLRIVLSDAPNETIEDYPDNPNDLIVHQQDIQAVVNALWQGGAEAVTIEGKRIVTTTGIKCSGSTVQLHGVPYPAPYEIEAVGETSDLLRALDSDAYVAGYRRVASDPERDLGWDLSQQDRVIAPAYDGPMGLRYAEPVTD